MIHFFHKWKIIKIEDCKFFIHGLNPHRYTEQCSVCGKIKYSSDLIELNTSKILEDNSSWRKD